MRIVDLPSSSPLYGREGLVVKIDPEDVSRWYVYIDPVASENFYANLASTQEEKDVHFYCSID